MRYSRITRARNQRRYAFIVIVIFFVLVGIYFLIAGTMGKAISNLITPILKSKQQPDELVRDESIGQDEDLADQEMELTLPNEYAQDDKATRITETIKVDAMSFLGIQIGAFNSKENAQSIANQLQSKGGAGYVLKISISVYCNDISKRK